ncbi:MAG: cyclic nucleotide-binding domain-containing protein [Gammaproteobacteria bacterium]
MDTLRLSEEDREALIAHYPLFSLLIPEDIKVLSNLMYEIYVPAGLQIVNEGDVVDSVYLIAGGLAEVTRHPISTSTKNDIIVAKLSKGEAIGFSESSFFSKTGIRTGTVTALSSTLLLGIGIDSFNQFMKKPERLYAGLQKSSNMFLKMNLIKRAEPFAELGSEELYKLVQKVDEISIPAGEYIFKQGEESHGCYLIQEGEVEILKNVSGNETQILLQPLSIFGLSSLLTLSHRNASARAKTACRLLLLKRKLLEDVLHYDIFLDKKRGDQVIQGTKDKIFRKYSFPIRKVKIEVAEEKAVDDSIITLKNTKENTYYQLSPEGWFVWNLLDGSNSVEYILKKYRKKFHKKDAQPIMQLLNELSEAHFIDLPLPDRRANKKSFLERLFSIFK